jgi:tetratricopeptide (TPR) repeat protein
MATFAGNKQPTILVRVIIIKRHIPNDFHKFIEQFAGSDSNLYDFMRHTTYNNLPLVCLPLGKDSVPLIIQSYLKFKDQEVDAQTLDNIVDVLLRLDKPRRATDDKLYPLFAIMLADYWINNNKLPLLKSQRELVEYAVRKEKNYIINSVNSACGEDEYLIEHALDIVSVATLIGGLHEDMLPTYLPKTDKYLQNTTRVKRRTFTEFAGLFHTGICYPIQPDIIGEYFLLMYLDNDNSSELFSAAWHNHYNAARVITRILQDYPEESMKLRKQVANIVIPDGIETIEYHAFKECDWIETVALPDTLKSIEHQAFYKCPRLYRINFPNGLERIGVQAFSGCERLTSVVLPNSLDIIECGAFLNSPQLIELEIPAKNIFDGSLFTVTEEFIPELRAKSFNNSNLEKRLIIYPNMVDAAVIQIQDCHLYDSPWYLSRPVFKLGKTGQIDLDPATMDCIIARYRVPIKTLFVRGTVSSNTQKVFTALGNNKITIFDKSKQEIVNEARQAIDDLHLSVTELSLLEAISLFSNVQIPNDVFHDEFVPVFENYDNVKVAIDALTSRGFLILENGYVSIADGVQRAIYRSQWLCEASTACVRHKKLVGYFVDSMHNMLRSDNQNAIENLLPCLKAISDNWRGEPCEEFTRFLHNLAGIFDRIGDIASAQAILNRSIAMSERVFGIDHPETGVKLFLLARLWAKTEGDSPSFLCSAKQLYNEALDIFEKNRMPYHPIALEAYFGLAEKSDFDYAYSMLCGLLGPCIEHFQEAAPDAANILYHIGILFLRKNQKLALPWLFHSYIIFMRADNPIEHPNRIPMVRHCFEIKFTISW